MKPRPLAVTILGWLFIFVGSVALLYHLSEFTGRHPFRYELVWVCLLRLLALLGGVFLLLARDWARWLLVAWMAYHLVLSLFHSPMELLMHLLLFGVIGYFLFRPSTSAYFLNQAEAPPPA